MAQRRRRQPAAGYGQILEQQGRNPLDQMMQQLMMMQMYQGRQGDSERAQLQRMGMQHAEAERVRGLERLQTVADRTDERTHAATVRDEDRQWDQQQAFRDALSTVDDPTRSPLAQERRVEQIVDRYSPTKGVIPEDFDPTQYYSTEEGRRDAATGAAAGLAPAQVASGDAAVQQLRRDFHLGPLEEQWGPQTAAGDWVDLETLTGRSLRDAVEQRVNMARQEDQLGLARITGEAGAREAGALPYNIATADHAARLRDWAQQRETALGQPRGSRTGGWTIDTGDRTLAQAYTVVDANTGEVYTLPKGWRGKVEVLGAIGADYDPDGTGPPLDPGTPYVAFLPASTGWRTDAGTPEATDSRIEQAVAGGMEVLPIQRGRAVPTGRAVGFEPGEEPPTKYQSRRVLPMSRNPNRLGVEAISSLPTGEDVMEWLEDQAMQDINQWYTQPTRLIGGQRTTADAELARRLRQGR